MKKFLVFLGLVLLIVVIVLVLRGGCGGDTSNGSLEFVKNESDGNYSVIRVKSADVTEVEIPATYRNKPVTRIGDDVFKGCTSLTKVTIPDSVKSIGDSAFAGCSALSSVTFGNGVQGIGRYAFLNCISLTSITLPDSVFAISHGAFLGCSELISVSLGNGVELVYDNAFQDCSKLTSIAIPDSVSLIGEGVFSKCDKLTSVYYTGDVAGWCAIEFTGVWIPHDHDVYINNERVTELVIPDSVTSVGDYLFVNCSGLTSVTIPDGVTSIGSKAFGACHDLTLVTIGKDVSEINYDAFSKCFKLIEVRNCSELQIEANNGGYGDIGVYAKRVYSSGESKQRQTDDGLLFYDDGTEVFLVSYRGADHELTLPDDYNGKTYGIYPWAFLRCSGLTSITLSDGVTSIGEKAFYECPSLSSIMLSEGVTSIGEEAFYQCPALSSISIPDSVTNIGEKAFFECVGLTEVTIGKGIQQIGASAFSSCSSLSKVTWNAVNCASSGVIKDDDNIHHPVFEGCINLKTVVIGNKVQRIPEYAFAECVGLTEITIPESVTRIDYWAFSGCSSLTSVTFANTDGWRSGGTVLKSTDATDPSVNAVELASSKRWVRQ